MQPPGVNWWKVECCRGERGLTEKCTCNSGENKGRTRPSGATITSNRQRLCACQCA